MPVHQCTNKSPVMFNMLFSLNIFRLCPLITESLSLNVTKLHETEASYVPVSILYSSIIQVLTGPHLLIGWFRYNLSISTMPPPRRRYA